MAVNALSFNQVSTLLAAINTQATGQATVTPTDVGEFISVAHTTLLAGKDPVINAISHVLSRTIFSIRPYNAKFAGMRSTLEKWGAITRKLTTIDKPFDDSKVYDLVDGQAIDMWVVNKPQVVQTNYYGYNIFHKSLTIFKDQLDSAFEGPQQFGSFITMIMTNVSDTITQAEEELARATVAGFIGGKIANDDLGYDDHGVIYLLDAYADETGVTLTRGDVMDPDNFPAFARWLSAKIKSLSDKMSERTSLYHTNLTGATIMRHTPKANQRIYMLSDFMNMVDATALSTTFNAEMASYGDYERVSFWQAIDTPSGIDLKVKVLKPDGTLSADRTVTQSNVIGVIADTEAFGYVIRKQDANMTPFNTRGEYWNYDYNFELGYQMDFTENGIVLVLDSAESTLAS